MIRVSFVFHLLGLESQNKQEILYVTVTAAASRTKGRRTEGEETIDIDHFLDHIKPKPSTIGSRYYRVRCRHRARVCTHTRTDSFLTFINWAFHYMIGFPLHLY